MDPETEITNERYMIKRVDEKFSKKLKKKIYFENCTKIDISGISQSLWNNVSARGKVFSLEFYCLFHSARVGLRFRLQCFNGSMLPKAVIQHIQ